MMYYMVYSMTVSCNCRACHCSAVALAPSLGAALSEGHFDDMTVTLWSL